VCLAGAPPARAEHRHPLVLADLLAEALRANPDLLAARKRWEAVQQRVPQATGLPAPRIGIELEEIPRGTFKVDEAMVMYSLIQALPFPGKLSARHQVALKDAQVAGMDVKRMAWDLVSQIKEAYYDLFRLDRDLEIQQRTLAWLEQALAAARAKYATGAVEQAEVLALQSELLEVANELQVLEHRRHGLEAHLNHLLNRPVHDHLGAPQPLALTPLPATPDELLAIASERQPELLAFRYSAERAEAAWRLEKRELLPDLETMLELRDPTMGPIGPWDLTLALVLPFWFWTKARYGVRAALYDRESAEAAYAAARNMIARGIHEHWHEAWAAYLAARTSAEGLLPVARQGVASALAGYQAGRTPYGELLHMLEMLNERERTYYEQLVMLEQHMAMLEEAAGITLRPAHDPTPSAMEDAP
jgi:outer membrane protein TolC